MVFSFLLLLSSVFAQTAGLENAPDKSAGAVSSSAAVSAKRFDFDGDGRADQGIFRPSNGTWYLANSGNNGVSIFQFGLSGDVPVAADYDGDGKTDAAVYRDGTWYRLKSATGTFDAFAFGLASDLPVPADFDGDGKYDIAVFRPSDGSWHRLNSASNSYTAVAFGMNGDVPLPEDYDGDGKADVNVFRSSNGTWYRLNSSNGSFFAAQFGTSGDLPQTGDFDGDSKADLAVWRPSNGVWYVQRSSNYSYLITGFGLPSDVPVAADYDGDGKTDVAVFRPSDGVWYRLNSSTGVFIGFQFGLSSDRPVPGRNNNNNTRPVASVEMSPATLNLTVGGAGQRVTAVAKDASGSVVTNVIFSWQSRNTAVAAVDQTGTVTAVAAGSTTIIAVAPNGVHSPTTVNVTGAATPTPTPTPTATPTATPTPTPTATPTPAPTATPTPAPTATPTPAPTATPTPTPSPSPSPTPNMFTCDYYASPGGTPSGNGTSGSPWDLQTALTKTTLVTTGKTLCLRGGTYVGKFRSMLNGGTVRSAPGEWARIDGYKYTTLPNAIDSVQTTFSVADGSGIFTAGTDEIVIGREVIKIFSKSGNTITGSIRGASNSMNGAEPHAAGSIVIIGGDPLYIAGTNTTYRDFEVMNSRPSRDGNTENQGIGRGDGVRVVSNGNRLVNLVIHDNLSGIMTSGASSNTEIYGCLIYNNGMHARTGGVEEGLGHGMYLENKSGYSKIYENIVLNSFNLGTQCYGVTAPYVGGEIIGCAFSNSGAPLGKFDVNKRNYNLIIGPDSQTSPTAVLKNSHLYHPANTTGYSVKFGYGAGVLAGTIADNFFVGGGTLFEIANTGSATFTGNQFYSPRTGAVYTIANSGQTYAWNNNTYHGAAGRNVFGVNGVGIYQLSNWRSLTGFDANSNATSAAMPDTVVVRPNAYQPGRANLMIYSFSGAAGVNVNLASTGLVNGQTYTIRNAQNYFGAPVLTGTYNSASPIVSVPLNGAALSVAEPIGLGYTPPSTCPQFCPMVVVPN